VSKGKGGGKKSGVFTAPYKGMMGGSKGKMM
jgi:hypothetical protein